MKSKLALFKASPPTYQSSKSFQSKNKGLVADTFNWDKEEVYDDEEETRVQVLMALTDDEISVILKSKAKPYPPCTHSGFNDHRPDDFRNYPKDGVLAESSQSNESSIGVSCTTCGSSVHSTTDHNDFEHFKRVDEIRIDDSSRYPPNEFLQEDDPFIQYQKNYDISYYIIPHGHSLTELTKEKHVPEVIAPNKHDNPQTENVEGPSDPPNTEETQQDVKYEQINHQSTKETLRINNENSVPIADSLAPKVFQSQDTNQASTSSYPVSHDRWLKDQHIEHVNITGNLRKGMLTRRSKWVFRNKKDERGIATKNKATLVAQGYHQEEGIDYDETFALVARMESIRIFLAFSTYMNFIVFQMDVKSAFLNRKVKEEVYVKQPPGFESSEFSDYVFNLKGYSNSNYAGCNIDRKSTLGSCQILGGKLVCWSAKKQQLVAMCLAELEYVVAAGYCANILWMKIQLSNYDIYYKMPLTLDFKTFTTSTSLDYNNGEYVAHPSPKPADMGLPSMVFDEGTVKTMSFPKGTHGDKGLEGFKPPADMEPLTTPVVNPSRTDAKYQVDQTQSARLSDKDDVLEAGEEMDETLGQNPSKTGQNRAQNGKCGKVKSQPKSTKSNPTKSKPPNSKSQKK
nr:copia protein [Tanacetum cinerariifolium]